MEGGCGGPGLPGVGMERFGGSSSSWEERGSGGMEGCLKWSGGLWWRDLRVKISWLN